MVKCITTECILYDIDHYGKYSVGVEQNFFQNIKEDYKIPYKNKILKLNPPKNNNYTFDENNLKIEPKKLINARCDITFNIREYNFENSKGERLAGYSCSIVKLVRKHHVS